MPNQNDIYTVGWICAVNTELVAAQAFLDEKHSSPEWLPKNDENDYTLGKFGEHNVVVTVLPAGEYGIASAASAARDMLRSFPNIRLGLMVGIGGGAPSKMHDIRLGDIVVSDPHDGNSGVFQYDFGKSIQNQSFRTTGFLSQPPRVLRTAVNGLRAQYELEGHQLENAVEGILENNPRLRRRYTRPSLETDRLYKSNFVHPQGSGVSCDIGCGDNPSIRISRPERPADEDTPVVHYGVIASANQLMKDALIRDKLAAEKNVLCFEMEAAGLMNDFPCLVVRGICDYADSHKNKEWQGYAAMVAAAYAKDLLCKIPPNRVDAEKRVYEVLHDLQEVAEAHKDVALKQLEIQQDAAQQKISEKYRECVQLLRLAKSTEDGTYEWYKDRVEDRVEGTCKWFLRHSHFQNWLKQSSGPLLVTADPGCGKSVLAKYLVDHVLPRSSTICYFFFKDQDQNTVRQALCALLHQLFSQRPSLTKHAMDDFDTNGSDLINSTRSLWNILDNVVQDSQAEPIIIVLDALDECGEEDFKNLLMNVERQSRRSRSNKGNLKYLLTSRPYEQVVSRFRVLLDAFPLIHIPGEEESDTISEEVNRVIEHRVEQLGQEKSLSYPVQIQLKKRLLQIQHRTYLWVYLIFDYLRAEDFKKTLKGVDSTISVMPKSITQAYEQILSKSKQQDIVRKVLSIILAAVRPLTLSELNVAMNIHGETKSFGDLDLEEEADFKSRLRSWCGLFVSIYHGKAYFIHQTAREFLLDTSILPTSTPIVRLQWHKSIHISYAHTILAHVCVRYLDLFNTSYASQSTLLIYSTDHWSFHFHGACIKDKDDIALIAVRICNPNSAAYRIWSNFHFTDDHNNDSNLPVIRLFNRGIENPRYSTGIMVASYLGHSAVVKLFLGKGIDLELKGDKFRRTPLLCAARYGNEAVVQLLLEAGANVEFKDNIGLTALMWASRKGHVGVVKLLLKHGANLESTEHMNSRTPLLWAAMSGKEEAVRLLLEKGAALEAKDKLHARTSLLWAIRNKHEAVVKTLLEWGSDRESKDVFGQTPLVYVEKYGGMAIKKLFENDGALDLDSITEEFQTISLQSPTRH
ncbi:hypothetical protein B0J11DRAFT_492734 [Dendryphion nanum]|uniref:Nucleoside phosphorylase domain-containing protein n=1 Tax=Dendryphion nanum TaxID=256645 RepID=A0A9P9IGN4_9PLEO|nr:hypothetical protein B0J11DRAFT_492734 [Dendryphion nanum]